MNKNLYNYILEHFDTGHGEPLEFGKSYNFDDDQLDEDIDTVVLAIKDLGLNHTIDVTGFREVINDKENKNSYFDVNWTLWK